MAEDERESGRRAILNFGHTFAHAIENCQGYGEWLHGEAVAAGMVMAAKLGGAAMPIRRDCASLSSGRAAERAAGHRCEGMLAAMSRDKKVQQKEIRLLDAWAGPG